MSRPTLPVQTVFFNPDDGAPARRLGNALYTRLTRDLKEPLAFGAGIPVLIASAPGHVHSWRPSSTKRRGEVFFLSCAAICTARVRGASARC